MDTENINQEYFSTLEAYVARLNKALKEGKGISFHNNGGVIVRNPPGIHLGDPSWDFIGTFHFGQCGRGDICEVESSSGYIFSGIDGPYKEGLFYINKGVPMFGYKGTISIPKNCVSGLRTIPRVESPVPKWNTDYGPILGNLSFDINHVHEGQAELFSFDLETRIHFDPKRT